MKLGLVGYGVGGRFFHAPFLQAADDIEIAGVVARAPHSVEAAHADLPGVPVHASLTDMIAAGGVDAVTITTPPASAQEGIHTVAVLEAARASAASGRTELVRTTTEDSARAGTESVRTAPVPAHTTKVS